MMSFMASSSWARRLWCSDLRSPSFVLAVRANARPARAIGQPGSHLLVTTDVQRKGEGREMRTTRRRFVAGVFDLVAVAGALGGGAPKAAFACLGGTWYLYCGNQYENAICGQIDRVTAGTCQHICSR